jgi:putative ABC transport system ATP-binding protein
LEQVDIAEHAHKLPSGLSGGEQQRAAIARALANDPPLVVADEPTGNLDTATANEVFELFERLVSEGKTLMVVTHDRNLSARTERVIRLLDGRIYQDENNGKKWTR